MGHLWLIGMMGSGKTEVGRRVAEILELPFVDTDDEVARRVGCSIAELWDRDGEQAFRELEAAEVAAVGGRASAVVATGGGVVTRDGNVAAMRTSGTVVWLAAEVDALADRVGAGSGRPLLGGGGDASDRLGELLRARRDAYRTAADVTVDTTGRTPDEIAEEVAALWNAS